MKEKESEKKETETPRDSVIETLKKNSENIRVKNEDTSTAPEESLQKSLERIEKEARENHDRFLRVSAEFENYKKRMAREKEDYRKFSNEALLKALLPVVDNLERAINFVADDEKSVDPVVQGVGLTLNEILNVFEKFAVKPISALKEPFDPAYHQAVMQEPSDEHPGNIVVKELQKGYLIHDRLLRPAMVVVSKGSGHAGEPKEKEASGNNNNIEV